tara:strand:+ start:9111 stop:10271 length:1161 start_codon:yes stop_codon:yes gene_type:complete
MAENFDLFEIDQDFHKEELSLRNKVRAFLNDKIRDKIADWFEQGLFPREIPRLFGEQGLLGSTISGYGCLGTNYTGYGLIMQEIERLDSGLRSFASVQGALVMYPIFTYGNEEIKEAYLPKLASGEWVGCFGLTEAEHGSNPGNMTCQLEDKGDHLILNGKKKWLTNGSIADLAVIWAKNEAGKVCGVVVQTNSPGVEFKTIENKFSLRASISSEAVFQKVKIPKSHLLNVEGLKGPFSCLNIARYGIAWGSIGAAEDCLEVALNYSQNRKQFHDQPLCSHQLVQAKLVEMYTEINKAKLLNQRLGRLFDAGKAQAAQISMAKMNNVSKALGIARMARDILGANGITYEHSVSRHLLNLESVNTYEGTEDIHRLILGQHLTGVSAF